MYFERWSNLKQYSGYTLFGDGDDGGTPVFNEIKQKYLGNCYFIASLASVGEYPGFIQNAFINKEKNKEGIYLIRFYIRGKPWVVSIDDNILVYKNYPNPEIVTTLPSDNAFWGVLLTKAWAKVKGSYVASEGGFMQTGMRSLTGAPVQSFKMKNYDKKSIDDLYEKLKEADKKGWVMGLGTIGSGSHDETTECGIACSHAYSIISVFTLKYNGKDIDMLLIRNPWGTTDYKLPWSAKGGKWTDELVK